MEIATFAFLVEHNEQKILFDLGVRKDWKSSSPPSLAEPVKLGGWKVEVEQDVPEILQDNGTSLDSIDAIIWSHHHITHTGDPSTFPSKTSLVVGPGFRRLFTPSYPDNGISPVLESAYAGREVREISFRGGFKLGRFPALDYFGDGSFYLLASPGPLHPSQCGLSTWLTETHSSSWEAILRIMEASSVLVSIVLYLLFSHTFLFSPHVLRQESCRLALVSFLQRSIALNQLQSLSTLRTAPMTKTRRSKAYGG